MFQWKYISMALNGEKEETSPKFYLFGGWEGLLFRDWEPSQKVIPVFKWGFPLLKWGGRHPLLKWGLPVLKPGQK
jgi:hypothetical protein